MLLKRIEDIIRRDLPPEMREYLTNSILCFTDVIFGRLSTISAEQNWKLIRSFEKKAADAESRAIHTRDKTKAECAYTEAQAYRSAIDEVIVTIKATAKEFDKEKKFVEEAAEDDLHRNEPHE